MLEIKEVSIDGRLFDLSMNISKGSLFALLGPNGAGKSSLLKAIAGIISLNRGSIFYDGVNLNSYPRAVRSRMIHFVPQGVSIPFDYTCHEIVSMACYGSKIKIEEAFERVDASDLMERPITKLSMGERQKIYIARALVTNCPILLFDEPTSNLDIRHQLEVWNLLQELKSPDRIIVVANHHLPYTTRYCEETGLIIQGSCLACGFTSHVLTEDCIKREFGIAYDTNGLPVIAI